MKPFIIVLSFAFSVLAGAQVPDAKTIEKENAEILGVDKNKNEVRDEVENYITKYLKVSDPKKYKAYFNYAKTLSLQLKHRLNSAELDKLDHLLYADRLCIYGFDGVKNGGNNITELRSKVLESYQRIKAWEISATNKSINSFSLVGKDNWLKSCR